MLISPEKLQKVVEAVLLGGGSEPQEAEIVEVAKANGVTAEQIEGMVGMKKPREGFP